MCNSEILHYVQDDMGSLRDNCVNRFLRFATLRVASVGMTVIWREDFDGSCE